MRTLLENLLRGERHSTDRYIYYDHTIEEQMKEWTEKALANKEKGIPRKTTIKEAMLTLDEAEITIGAKHSAPIQDTKMELEKVRGKMAEVKESCAHYVESEKKTIPDREYERIDKLEAKLKRMESQAQEHEAINSQLNHQDHERQD